jgi:thiamine-phosphate diphosphorylase / hydroxyethylthiazole kinase
LTVPLCGIKGLREILKFTASQKPPVRTVAIGGLNVSNIARVRYQSETEELGARLDGVAVVSALMGASNPKQAAEELRRVFESPPSFIIRQKAFSPSVEFTLEHMKDDITRILNAVQEQTPLVHHLTNNVFPSFPRS